DDVVYLPLRHWHRLSRSTVHVQVNRWRPSSPSRRLRCRLRRLSAAEGPGNPELIRQDAETETPEGLLERHLDRGVLRERVEQPFRVGRIVGFEKNPKPFRWLVTSGRR